MLKSSSKPNSQMAIGANRTLSPRMRSGSFRSTLQRSQFGSRAARFASDPGPTSYQPKGQIEFRTWSAGAKSEVPSENLSIRMKRCQHRNTLSGMNGVRAVPRQQGQRLVDELEYPDCDEDTPVFFQSLAFLCQLLWWKARYCFARMEPK
jgi:hypothetical protein